MEQFARGIELKDFTCQPAKLKILEVDEEKETSLVEISLAEGKFHQDYEIGRASCRERV